MVIVEESGCSSAILSDHVRIQIVLQAQGRRLIRLPSFQSLLVLRIVFQLYVLFVDKGLFSPFLLFSVKSQDILIILEENSKIVLP